MLTRVGGYIPENPCENYRYIFEKDSILLYSEVRGMLPRQDQDIIDMITSEEKKHLSELTYIANKLRGG